MTITNIRRIGDSLLSYRSCCHHSGAATAQCDTGPRARQGSLLLRGRDRDRFQTGALVRISVAATRRKADKPHARNLRLAEPSRKIQFAADGRAVAATLEGHEACAPG